MIRCTKDKLTERAYTWSSCLRQYLDASGEDDMYIDFFEELLIPSLVRDFANRPVGLIDIGTGSSGKLSSLLARLTACMEVLFVWSIEPQPDLEIMQLVDSEASSRSIPVSVFRRVADKRLGAQLAGSIDCPLLITAWHVQYSPTESDQVLGFLAEIHGGVPVIAAMSAESEHSPMDSLRAFVSEQSGLRMPRTMIREMREWAKERHGAVRFPEDMNKLLSFDIGTERDTRLLPRWLFDFVTGGLDNLPRNAVEGVVDAIRCWLLHEHCRTNCVEICLPEEVLLLRGV